MTEIGIALILKQVATREIISTAFNKLNLLNKSNKGTFKLNKSDFEKSFTVLANDAMNWSQKLNIIGLDSNQDIVDLYIDTNFYLTPQKFQYRSEIEKPNLLSKIIESEIEHCVIFGKPGMGKTTSMKMLTRKIILEENYMLSYFSIPIIIRLRELREKFSDVHIKRFSKMIVFQFIAQNFSLRAEKPNDDFFLNKEGILSKVVFELIENIKPVIIIDGFDEIDIKIRDDVFAQIKEITYKTKNAKILLTSRTGEFSYQIEKFNYFEIANFNDSQIISYAKKFLGNEKGQNFYEDLVSSSYQDIAIKPLLLSFLCSIYKHREELPAKPRYIYAEIIDILINKWDRNRGVVRNSKFQSFGKEEKIEFLSILSFKLLYTSKVTFDKMDIIEIFNSIHQKYELKKNNAESIFNEIEEHSGLFIQSGADRYEFPHKSIQEYLASKYLLSITNLSKLHRINNIPHECALMVALSANPSERLFEVLKNVSYEEDPKFVSAFVERLASENPRFEPNYRIPMEISKFLFNGPVHIRNKTANIARKLYEIKSLKKSYKQLEKYFKVNQSKAVNLLKEDFIEVTPKISEKKWKKQKVHAFHIHEFLLEEWN